MKFPSKINPVPLFSSKKKEILKYRNLSIMADMYLHDQIEFLVNKQATKGSKILILGSGEGALDNRLKDLSYKVFSSDIDDKNFKGCTKYIHADFNNFRDMNEISRKYKAKFDVVLSIEIVEHLENIGLYFSTINKVLKRNGLVIVSTPNISSWHSRLFYFVFGVFPSFNEANYKHSGHINPVSKDELRRLLVRHNLDRNIHILPGGFLPKLWLPFKGLGLFFYNLLGFLLRPFMLGKKDGWCTIVVSNKR